MITAIFSSSRRYGVISRKDLAAWQNVEA